MTWAPLLDGSEATAAHQVVRGIAQAAAADRSASPCDRAVFWSMVAASSDEPWIEAAWSQAIDALVESAAYGVPHLGLHGGLAGLGWTLAHVIEDSEALATIDEALYRAVGCQWDGPIDVMHGLAGIALYFFDRGDKAIAREAIERIVHLLERTAIKTDAGTTWRTEPRIMPAAVAAAWPEGFFDCGLAHGVPGICRVLARAAGDVPVARALADDAVRWVLAQSDADGGFPGKLSSRTRQPPPDDAWCCGTPGIALGLWTSTRTAVDIARGRATTIDPQTITEAGLCHGAAGLAHLYNRLHQATGEGAFAAAARTWLRRVLELPRTGTSLIEGSLGVGLALLAAVTPIEPIWDHLLLCDVGGQAGAHSSV
jgi:hypothetical protein